MITFAGQRLSTALDDYVLQWDLVRPIPASGDWYLAEDQFAVDHYVLYHGFGEAIEHARAADVLIAGTSLVQFMFPYESLERFRQESGVRAYNLAFSHAESSAFTLALIERQGLKPRFLVAGTHLFFRPRPSDFGERVIEANRWDAWKAVFEHATASRVRYGPFAWLPRWQIQTVSTGWQIVLHRSSEYGSWYATRERLRTVTPRSETVPLPPPILPQARAVRDSLAALGVELVLLHAPFGWDSRESVQSLADSLGVFAIIPEVSGLRARDEEHLTDDSGRRYAEVALRELGEWIRTRHATATSESPD